MSSLSGGEHGSIVYAAFIPNARETVLPTFESRSPQSKRSEQSSGELIDTAITRELTDVFNIAVGLENRFSEKLTAYGSFRTDRSGFDPRTKAAVPIGDWDLYHVAAGTTFTVGRSQFTTGAIVSYGDSSSGRVFEPVEGVVGTDDGIRVDYFRLSFLIGFNFAFE